MPKTVSISELQGTPHRRYNPLTGEWVVVSPHRTKRPWQGRQETAVRREGPRHDPDCYLCPGNTRAGGEKNPDYTSTFSFTNDFSALLPETRPGELASDELFRGETERGLCRVICFSPAHNLTIARMSPDEVLRVVDLWAEEYRELSRLDYISYVQIFENRGEIMGCSNPHPHGQIWCNETIPDLPGKETTMQTGYFERRGTSLLMDYLERELAATGSEGSRVVLQNDDFAVLVPFWAVWPYETMVLPKRAAASIEELTPQERRSLAEAIRILTIKYDNLFETSFPYSMGLHNAPCDGKEYPGWQFHLHYFPPLLRSATVKKFMVGYELLASPQRDITPETSAAILRDLPPVHYLDTRKDDDNE